MDKILAFSILSSSPADLAAGGYSTRLSWWSGGAKRVEEKAANKQEEKAEQASRPEKKQEAAMARFAPEFDGINCFESIVSF